MENSGDAGVYHIFLTLATLEVLRCQKSSYTSLKNDNKLRGVTCHDHNLYSHSYMCTCTVIKSLYGKCIG